MNLLIFLTHPEPTRSAYESYLAPRHPELTIKTLGERDEALRQAAWADIIMCFFGPEAGPDFFKNTQRLKWVHSLGTGTDGISDSPYLGKDIIITATRGIHGAPMSEVRPADDAGFQSQLPPHRQQRAERVWERWAGLRSSARPWAY